MASPAGESSSETLKLDLTGGFMLQFRGSVVTSDSGLLAYRELDALGGRRTRRRRHRQERPKRMGLLSHVIRVNQRSGTLPRRAPAMCIGTPPAGRAC